MLVTTFPSHQPGRGKYLLVVSFPWVSFAYLSVDFLTIGAACLSGGFCWIVWASSSNAYLKEREAEKLW
jgi:nitrate reductase NapE component